MNRLFTIGFMLVLSSTASALTPEEIFILVNKNDPRSSEVAEYYCKKRKVPVENIITLDPPSPRTSAERITIPRYKSHGSVMP